MGVDPRVDQVGVGLIGKPWIQVGNASGRTDRDEVPRPAGPIVVRRRFEPCDQPVDLGRCWWRLSPQKQQLAHVVIVGASVGCQVLHHGTRAIPCAELDQFRRRCATLIGRKIVGGPDSRPQLNSLRHMATALQQLVEGVHPRLACAVCHPFHVRQEDVV